MVDTLPNIPLTANTWVDLYDVSGISVGTQIIIQNLGDPDVFLAAQSAQPTTTDGYHLVERSEESINQVGDAGAWAYSANTNGAVNVRVA